LLWQHVRVPPEIVWIRRSWRPADRGNYFNEWANVRRTPSGATVTICRANALNRYETLASIGGETELTLHPRRLWMARPLRLLLGLPRPWGADVDVIASHRGGGPPGEEVNVDGSPWIRCRVRSDE
jgi:hypothetical protein